MNTTANIQLTKYPTWEVENIEEVIRIGLPPEIPLMDYATIDNLRGLGSVGYTWVVFNLRKGKKTRESKPYEIYKLIG